MIKGLPNKITLISILFFFLVSSCAKDGFFKPGDARKNSPDPRERVKKNLEEGKGFRLNDAIGGSKGTNFEFASSNELWRASLDVLDFMPIETIDPFSGVIVKGFGVPPGGETQYRATIYVVDPALEARSLRVSMQTKSGPVSTATMNEIENAILSRARQMRKADGLS